jgi:hypothetical protein
VSLLGQYDRVATINAELAEIARPTRSFAQGVRAREPVEWPALGVGDRQDEYVMLVLFERDHAGEP